MKPVIELIWSEASWSLAGWTMLHFLWVGTAMLGLAALCRLLIRNADARVRYLFAASTLAGLVCALFVIAVCVASSTSVAVRGEVHGLSHDHRQLSPGQHAAHDAPATVPDGRISSTPGVESASNRPSVAVMGSSPSPSADTGAVQRVERIIPRQQLVAWQVRWVVRHLPWLWVVGTPLTFALLATGLVGAERMRRGCLVLEDGPIVQLCKRTADALKITRQVAVGVCDRVAAPVLIGIFKPLILLPTAALSGWSPDELQMVFLHELAHVRRWDNLVNLAQRVCESLLFFHPAVWIVSAWVREEREHCCDAVVVAQTGRPRAYAKTLTALAAGEYAWPNLPSSSGPAQTVISAMAQCHLVTRLRHILNKEREPMQVSRKTLAAVLGWVVMSLAVAGWFRQSMGETRDGEVQTATESKVPDESPASREEASREPSAANTDDEDEGTAIEQPADVSPLEKLFTTESSGSEANAVAEGGPNEKPDSVSAPVVAERDISAKVADLDVQQARIEYDFAKAEYDDGLSFRKQRIMSETEFRRIERRLRLAKIELERVTFLRDHGQTRISLGSRTSDDEAITHLDVEYAQKAFELAELNYQEAVQANQKFRGAISEIEVRRRKIAVETAKLELERLKLRAARGRTEADPRWPKNVLSTTTDELSYDSKTFEEWNKEWMTELKPQRRIEAVHAFDAFARRGYASAAAKTIVQGMKGVSPNKPEAELYNAAVNAISAVEASKSLPVIQAALIDADANIFPFAMSALSRMGHNARDAIPMLLEIARNRNLGNRWAAIDALASIDRSSDEVTEVMRESLTDEDRAVVLHALKALYPDGIHGARRFGVFEGRGREPDRNKEELVPELVGAALHSDDDVAESARMILLSLGTKAQPAVPELIKGAKSNDVALRIKAVRALGAIGPAAQQATDVIKNAMQSDNDELRTEAANALGLISGQPDEFGSDEAQFRQRVFSE